MYNGAENVSSGADRGPNEGGFDEGARDIPIGEASEDEDAVSNEEKEEGEKKVKIEVSEDSEDDEYDGFVKTLPNPILPTQAMIDCHMVTHTHTHTPFANWCPNCV